jgi:sporulation protein YlmC with PRC-barrel domain
MKITKTTSLASALAILLATGAAYADKNEPSVNSEVGTRSVIEYKEGSAERPAPAKPAHKTNMRHETEANDSAMTRDVKAGLKKADAVMHEGAEDVKAFFVGDENTRIEPVTFRRESTSAGLLDKAVLNPQGEKIATVEDILIDANGKATHVVVADGGMMGIGAKLAAFDYGKIVAQRADGKVVASLTQNQIDNASKFSYDRDDAAEAKILPKGSTSVKELLDGEVWNASGDKIGSIDNVSFVNGKTDRLIIGFDKTMGMGGKMAAIDYSAVEKIRKDGQVDVKLSSSQSAQFVNFKKNTELN